MRKIATDLLLLTGDSIVDLDQYLSEQAISRIVLSDLLALLIDTSRSTEPGQVEISRILAGITVVCYPTRFFGFGFGGSKNREP